MSVRAIFEAAGMYVNLAFYIQKLTDNVSRFDSDGIVGEFKREKHINMAPVSAMHNQQQAPSPIKAASTLDGAAMTDTTLDCSFESAGEGESLTITFLQLELDEEQQGLETPLTGSNFWSAKSNSQAPMTAPAPVTPMQESQRANDKTYPAATFKLVDVHATPVPPLVDPDDCECIETTENGVLQDTQQNEEGFEMNLSDYEETTRFILLDLQGAEVATTGKRVRFEIDGEDDLSVKATTTSRNRRKQIVKFLRSKSKKEDSIVGSPQVSQLALESEVKPSILKESSYPISGREGMVSTTSLVLCSVVHSFALIFAL